jgi:hypothetical protein
VLTKRSLSEIAGDEGSDEWQSNRKAAVRKGAEWLQGSVNREIGKSGNRKTQKQIPEGRVIKSGVTQKATLSAKNAETLGHPPTHKKRNSPSTPKKKTSVKKKTRKAA